MTRAFALLLALIAGPAQAGPAATAPQRVVSMNLCTDQLAMLLAAPGQLVSVSPLASDPVSSVMAEQAKAYSANSGLAEDIYLLKPDLVLAGAFTGRATVAMLERLGIPVAIFPPAASIADVRQGMLDMGRALGHEPQAEAMVADFDARLSALASGPGHAPRPTAAAYAANGYNPGRSSLSGEIIEAAGFHNLAGDLGMETAGFVPLEALVMADPDLVITGNSYGYTTRAEEILRHPALARLTGGRQPMEDRDWICGLPSVLDAVERLGAARQEVGR